MDLRYADILDLVWGSRNTGTNIVSVDKDKHLGDFTTITEALASITGASPGNPYVIVVNPGIYAESNLTLYPGVAIVARSLGSVIIAAPNGADTIVFGADASQLVNIILTGAYLPGGRGVYYEGSGGTGFLMRDCNFNFNHTGLECVSNGFPSLAYIDRVSFTGNNTYGYIVTDDGVHTSQIILANCAYKDITAPVSTRFVYASGIYSSLSILNTTFRGEVTAGTCIHISDGATLTMLSSSIRKFNKAVYVENTGAAPHLEISGCGLFDNTVDIDIDHITCTGTFSGISSHAKISSASPNFKWAFLDETDGQFEVTDSIALTYSQSGVHTDITRLLLDGSTMGVLDFDGLSDGGGLIVNVSTGTGYYEDTVNEIVHELTWPAQTFAMNPDEDKYLYFNNSGVLSSSSNRPSNVENIILGRVVTNGVGIIFIVNAPTHADHTSNRYGNLFRSALGPIYASGSSVTENVIPFELDVASGEYYYSTNQFNPSGGTDITFIPCWGGVAQTPSTTVNSLDYDPGGLGVMTPIGIGKFVKHSLYVVGDGADETYFLVYGQQEFSNLSDAENGVIPVPPTFIRAACALIAGIVIQEGALNIASIVDQRPVIGFRASSTSSVSDHASLSGLVTGNAGHTQFMMLDGSTPMANNLNMGGNQITNITTIAGYLLANWIKSGTNTFGADTTIGLFDAFEFALKTANTKRLIISATGEVSIVNLAGGGDVALKADNTGKISPLGYTPENVANKQTDLTPSATKYPTVNAVNTGLAGKQDTLTNGYGISGTTTKAVALSSAEAFITGTVSLSTATYADITGASISLAAGTWLIMASVYGYAQNAACLLNAAITDSANSIVTEGSQGAPASGAANAQQWASVSLSAIVVVAAPTTYKLRGARGNTTVTATITVANGSGAATTNNASNGSNKGTGIRAIRIS